MERLCKFLDHPLIMYLVISAVSLFIAMLCWAVSGNVAKVGGVDPVWGTSIELGGAIAGFFAVFTLSFQVFKRLYELKSQQYKIKIFLVPRDKIALAENSKCSVKLYDDEEGVEKSKELIPRKEAGFFTIDLIDLGRNDRFQIEFTDKHNKVWRSEYHNIFAPRAEMSEAQ